MTAVLDDFDSRPGSATSLLRTIIGVVMRDQDGWMSTASLLRLMESAGVPELRTRTALTRVKAKGLISAETRPYGSGYALSAEAIPMLTRGDRRIVHPRVMTDDEPWSLISFSIPEDQRDLRHQLRKRLTSVGAGTVSQALWITPRYLRDDVVDIVTELGLNTRVTLFAASEIDADRPLKELAADWWDLDAIGGLHQKFLVQHRADLDIIQNSPTSETAFGIWIRVLDTWRPIPYLDPGLPPSLLPADWLGNVANPLYVSLRDSAQPLAMEYARSVCHAHS